MKITLGLLLLIGISYFIAYNEAYRNGENLAKQLCNCYNNESDRFEDYGINAIIIPDKYIYFTPNGYPYFRDGFLGYAIIYCQQYGNKLLQWRGIGQNKYPVTQQ